MYPTILHSHDDELRQRVLNSLHEKGLDRLSEVDLSVCGGVVTLQGRFGSSDVRNRSLDCCRHVAAVLRVIDCTEVAEKDSITRQPTHWSLHPAKLATSTTPVAYFG